MIDEKILLIGGSGSLGNAFIQKHINNNIIVVFSRDECKHWQMKLKYESHKHLSFVIGCIRDYDKITTTLIRHKPTIIVIAAALKHIDKCEIETEECIKTNLQGTVNVLKAIEMNQSLLSTVLKKVCFVSTDKACSPINIYGMCKAASECCIIDAMRKIPWCKFVVVRYGNVLNSRGSIIPILHEIGMNPSIKKYTLTDENMTRFVMTLDQSVDLIDHALKEAPSGMIVIPTLVSLRVKDLIEIFAQKYEKKIEVTGLRPGEKILESLINETQSKCICMSYDGKYTYIQPSFLTTHEHMQTLEAMDYNSLINPMTKDELFEYLNTLNLL